MLHIIITDDRSQDFTKWAATGLAVRMSHYLQKMAVLADPTYLFKVKLIIIFILY